ncbi:unnamed protein product [Clonostachys rosea f. rosea IK726]|uniref:Uncharacterized protein n=2 Tax=Bionectria ochroleuca TaxID=29856 RepID=A0A0B7KKS5_BIOOC|nr:unnamed protein product [Clonostachys rosea f. rosea IK726]
MAYLTAEKPSDAVTSPYGLYITMQFLSDVDGQNKYHWGLFLANGQPPKGQLLHAVGQSPDLNLEIRNVADPRRLGRIVACLQISTLTSTDVIEACAKSVGLMDPKHVPSREARWTSRVWVKQVLVSLNKGGHIKLPMTVDELELYCQAAADSHLQTGSRDAWLHVANDTRWLS